MASVFLSRSLRTSSKVAERIARTTLVRSFASAPANSGAEWSGGLPDSIKRVGEAVAIPDEYPGMVYEFNWALNGDGVTPLKRSAFRIGKPLDLQIAGLNLPKTNPLKVKTTKKDTMIEAGSTEALTFEQFDDVCQAVRDYLSLSNVLYCPEGHVPGTTTGVRVITNSSTLPSDLVGYLDRCPKKSPPGSMPITVFVFENNEDNTIEDFSGYSIEEIEVQIDSTESPFDLGYVPTEAKSVASVVVAGNKPSIKSIVAGIEASQNALAQDEIERAAKKAEEAEQKE